MEPLKHYAKLNNISDRTAPIVVTVNGAESK